MPAAADEVRARTEKDTVKVVIHCQGSCAFMMAITAGLLPDVSVVVSNSSALHPMMPRIARIKLPLVVNFGSPRIENVNPQWGIHAPRFWPKVLNTVVRAAGEMVSTGKYDVLPPLFTAEAPKTDARFVFMTGDRNQTFLPEGRLELSFMPALGDLDEEGPKRGRAL
jgi:hypothetical protein